MITTRVVRCSELRPGDLVGDGDVRVIAIDPLPNRLGDEIAITFLERFGDNFRVFVDAEGLTSRTVIVLAIAQDEEEFT